MENLDAAPERDIRRRYVIGLVARELADAVGPEHVGRPQGFSKPRPMTGRG